MVKTAEMSQQAIEATVGATDRAERAAGLCSRSFETIPRRSLYTHTDDVYRGHRCSRELNHGGRCKCRYCGTWGAWR